MNIESNASGDLPADADILALNKNERFFSESPSKYPEAGHGTQYHAGAPGVLGFARAVLALASPQVAPAPDYSVKTPHELVMKWADIYAAQTGNLYTEAARHPSKTACMAPVRADLSRVLADALIGLLPPPVSAGDARDAARYRWLRDEHIGDDPCSISLSSETSGLDAVIDKRMLEDALASLAAPAPVAPTPAQPAGTVRFDIAAEDCFEWSGHTYPMVTCMDCRATEYGITKIEHLPGCRVAAALATLPSEPEGDSQS